MRARSDLSGGAAAWADPSEEFPPVVYVPTCMAEDGQMHVEMKMMLDGRSALLVYSALDRLRRWYGDTSWMVTTIEGLQRLYDDRPYDVLFLDRSIVPEAAGDSRPQAATSPVSDDGRPTPVSGDVR
ncbi:MAG: hypothetical protein LBQ06_02880 [Frankiaceae bacterium]|nr:hypothetical protein [Frankiaceae bacterium]